MQCMITQACCRASTPFEERHAQLAIEQAEAARLDAEIEKNFEMLGFGRGRLETTSPVVAARRQQRCASHDRLVSAGLSADAEPVAGAALMS